MKIEKTMLIGELIHMDELIPQMLMGAGMHCLGCPASQAESLEEACMVHGIDCDDLVSKMNEILADREYPHDRTCKGQQLHVKNRLL